MARSTPSIRSATAGTWSPVTALFAAQAARTPDAPAARAGDVVWSYGELAARVNRLARYLSSRGIGRGAFVPVLAGARPEALQAMLAVMQTGAACVPLDPAYATPRLATAIEESHAPLLLSTCDAAPAAPAVAGVSVVTLDDVDLSGLAADPVVEALDPADVAYVMYTSGTTGTPNGVEATHGGLANYLTWCTRYYPIAHGDGAVVHTSIGFDLTLTSLFVPLLAGQTVWFVSADPQDVEPLARALRGDHPRYSFLKMTPSHWRALRHLVSARDLARATGCLILGGEPLRTADLAGFDALLGGELRVFNEYGPTETVVGSICAEVVRLPAASTIPIGTPIDNTTVYVCDAELNVLPSGETGELCIGGAGVARGYHAREDLTARRFVTRPGPAPERVYRTSDLGRLGADGQFECLGRQDRQVKIGGYRVELEDIEATLRSDAAVTDAVVLLDAAADPPRLVAGVVPNVSRREVQSAAGRVIRQTVTPTELHRTLASRLPAYMVPSRFVLLDAIPRTVHGKVDEEAVLRAAAADGVQARAAYVMPRTDLEETLVAVFANVLRVDDVGIDDDFFALGGDSIRSIQIAGELQRRGIKLSVGDLHRFPTIRALGERHADRGRGFVEMPDTKPFDLIAPEDRARMPDDVEDAYPMNLLQEGMIYHRAFAAKSAVYHAMLSLTLRAPFDLPALRHVVQELVNRHPLLRTSFDQHRFSLPLQLVHQTFKDPLQFRDASGLSEAEQRVEIERWAQDEQRRGFDIDEYPLIRFMVHRLAEDRFQLTFSYHHEIIDGWSESTMVSELLTHYLSLISGEPVEITAPKASFRDSVLLEQMALKSSEFRAFWEKALEGANFMRLPRLLSSPKADKGQRAIVKLHFPFESEASARLKRLALTLGVPLKSVLLAGHMKVMGLFGGSRDVVTHTVSNGRPENPDGAGLIGLFVNSFTFRQPLTHASWRELILDTLKLEQASMPYRRYPMAELKRHQGRDPLSETLFFLIHYHIYQRLERWKNAELVRYDVYGESTFPFCATFRVNHFTSELDMQIEYDSLQFPRELIDAIAETYFRVYQAMTADPSARHHLFAPAPAPAPRLAPAPAPAAPAAPAAIHHWFEDQARRTPDATAIICGAARVSYAELNARANRLGRAFARRGIGPESTVALLLDRSIDLVAAMLGVLKAGACYVPLDPEHRSERTAACLQQCAPALLVRSAGLAAPADGPLARTGAEIRSVEELWAEASRLDAREPRVPLAPESAAYIIFTSGSTGAPKGVVVPHGTLIASTRARLTTYDRPPARFLLLSSHAFDSSVAGLYWTLCTGGTLVLPPGAGAPDLNQALNLTRDEEITHTLCIPSFYASLLESARPDDLASLQAVIVAGEECRSEVWARHQAKAPAVAFYNEYGPSEATVWSTVWKGDPSVLRASLPIGTPIDGVTAVVLDADGHVAPVGVAGELSIGGATVARGYLASPAATAARFLPDPFATQPGARSYRTGDLARTTLQAEMDYLGRVDHQLKVRGFRIEPAEIEAVLETHPHVKRAVVVLREDEAAEKVLVAYAVPAARGELTSADLQALAQDRLPKYLIPSTFVIVEALPLTATGKVDRQALPVVSLTRGDRSMVAPRTPTEEAIAGIWARVLGVERVGVLDDFYELGGESLRAMRILSQIRKAFDVELPIATLVQTQATVAALAEEVDAALWLRIGPTAGPASQGFEDVVV